MIALSLPTHYRFPHLATAVSPGDTMFDGRSDHYLDVGLSALDVIESALAGCPAPRTILDIPCGFGRVTRVLRARYPDAAITACDLDHPGVDFTAATFGAEPAYSVTNFRDLHLAGPFDLIWVGSLLTHLPEHQTRQFLDFAIRHMGPQSRLVVTSHGEHVAARLRSSTYGLSDVAACGVAGQYLRAGYGYRGYDGGPDYGISLAAPAWYEALLAGSPLRLHAYQERGWDSHQDALVLRLARGQPASGPGMPFFDTGQVKPPLDGAEQERRDRTGADYFDEAWYCRRFADVAAAVRDGAYPSGFAHFVAYGWREGRPPFDPAAAYTSRATAEPDAWYDGAAAMANRVSQAWSVSPEEQAAEGGWYWMAHPMVRHRSNLLASGDPNADAYDRLGTILRQRGWSLPISRAVSIGCGFGALERDLAARGFVREVDAYDIAAPAIAEAQRQAQHAGLEHLRYHVRDLESIDLAPGSVEAVFAHSSVHHVERLEALYAVVQRTLRAGGIFHLHEFVGPTRFQWTDAQLQLANAFLDGLPSRLRRLPNGTPKERLRRPTIEDMIMADPSEAVRSAELVSALEPYFEVIEVRALGGALAHLALGGIAQNFDPESAEDRATLQTLFDMEDAAMAAGTIGSDFATITATPKPVAHQEDAHLQRSRSFRLTSLFPSVRRATAR